MNSDIKTVEPTYPRFDESQFDSTQVNLEDKEIQDIYFASTYFGQNTFVEFVASDITPGDVLCSIIVSRSPTNNGTGCSVIDTQVNLNAAQIARDVIAQASSGFQRSVINCLGVRITNNTGAKLVGRVRIYQAATIARQG